MARVFDLRWTAVPGLLVAVLTLALSGCGADGFSRDAVIESSASDAFLDRVQRNCGTLTLGEESLAGLLNPNEDDASFEDSSDSITFLDATSKLYLGQFSRQDYADFVDSAFMGNNQAALSCIYGQL